MRLLNKISIRNKLISIILLVSTFSLLVGFTVVILNDIKTFKSDLAQSMVTTTRIIGDYSVTDLAFKDKEASQKTLAELAGIASVEAAYLFDIDSKLFSYYVREGIAREVPSVRKASAEFSGDFLHVYQPIRWQGKDYGMIYLKVSTVPLQMKVREYLLTMIALMIGLIVISLFLGISLQRLISEPILDLADTAKKISEKDDYSIRVHKFAEDEIGTLSDGFNKMLSQIQSRQEERDLAEEALRESEDRYRGLVESSPEPIIVEQDLKIVYMNPVGLQMLGYDSIQEVQGMAVEALLYSPDAVLRNNPEQQPVSPMEIQFKSKDGRPVDVEVSFIRTTYQGKPATQGIARNITEKKLLQQSAQRMERLAAIGEFAAVIAHEMRNSLGSISLNFRYLSEKLQVPETYQKNFNNIQKSIERIQEVIKEILEFSRPAPPVFRKVPIEKVLDSSILTVEKDLEHAGVLLERNYSSISKDVSVDANQISRVFVNLFLNAVQAASSGGTITVRTEEDSQKVFVHIEDTGKGIPTENLKKIFDPFFTTRPEGVGLGLAIVSRTLEQHSAEICVKSEVGKGTGFTITFPVAK